MLGWSHRITISVSEKLQGFFFGVFTFVGNNLVCLEEEGPMLQVHDLTLQLVLHHIDQGQLITQVLIIEKNAISHSQDTCSASKAAVETSFPINNVDLKVRAISSLP